MRKLENEVNANNARNANSTNNTKQSTLPKVRAAQTVVARRAINFAKVSVAKVMCWNC